MKGKYQIIIYQLKNHKTHLIHTCNNIDYKSMERNQLPCEVSLNSFKKQHNL